MSDISDGPSPALFPAASPALYGYPEDWGVEYDSQGALCHDVAAFLHEVDDP